MRGGLGGGAVVEHRIEQELECHRHVLVDCALDDASGEPATGTGPADPDPCRVDAELVCSAVKPPQGGEAVIVRCGERVLGSETVAGAHHNDSLIAGEAAAQVVVVLGPAEEGPASVDPQQRSA